MHNRGSRYRLKNKTIRSSSGSGGGCRAQRFVAFACYFLRTRLTNIANKSSCYKHSERCHPSAESLVSRPVGSTVAHPAMSIGCSLEGWRFAQKQSQCNICAFVSKCRMVYSPAGFKLFPMKGAVLLRHSLSQVSSMMNTSSRHGGGKMVILIGLILALRLPVGCWR